MVAPQVEKQNYLELSIDQNLQQASSRLPEQFNLKQFRQVFTDMQYDDKFAKEADRSIITQSAVEKLQRVRLPYRIEANPSKEETADAKKGNGIEIESLFPKAYRLLVQDTNLPTAEMQ